MLSSIKLEWQYFLLALGFFTRIPVPSLSHFQEADLNDAAKYFPLVGLIVGLFGAGVFVVSAKYLPQNIAVLTSMMSTIYLTGAFHEDGLADSADGLGGGWQREQILTIMQDSRLGTYGAIALCLALLAKFQTLSTLSPDWIPVALLVAHPMSRFAAILLMATLNYAKPSGKAKPLATVISGLSLLWAGCFGLLPLGVLLLYLGLHHYSFAVLVKLILMIGIPMVMTGFWWQQKIKKWLGGYTGDTLGAMQQITELAFYFGFVLWSVNQ